MNPGDWSWMEDYLRMRADSFAGIDAREAVGVPTITTLAPAPKRAPRDPHVDAALQGLYWYAATRPSSSIAGIVTS